jgi:hypothetical protein
MTRLSTILHYAANSVTDAPRKKNGGRSPGLRRVVPPPRGLGLHQNFLLQAMPSEFSESEIVSVPPTGK